MTKHTTRDIVWHLGLQHAMAEECFKIGAVREGVSGSVSDRTIRDTLNTMVDHGWLSKEKVQGHEWAPGPRARGEEVDDSQSEKINEPPSVDEVERPSDLEKGMVYSGVVDKCKSNALIMLKNGHLNLGPIDENSVGERVKFEYLGGVWGKCLNEELIYESYSPYDGRSSSSSSSHTSSGLISSSSSNPFSKGTTKKNGLLNGKL